MSTLHRFCARFVAVLMSLALLFHSGATDGVISRAHKDTTPGRDPVSVRVVQEALSAQSLFAGHGLSEFPKGRKWVSAFMLAALAIPSWVSAATQTMTTATTQAVRAVTVSYDTIEPIHVVIREGWNLSRYAKLYHTSVDALLSWNPQITDPNVIYTGHDLIVPAVQKMVTTMPGLPDGTASLPPIPAPPDLSFLGFPMDLWSQAVDFSAYFLMAGAAAALLWGGIRWIRGRSSPRKKRLTLLMAVVVAVGVSVGGGRMLFGPGYVKRPQDTVRAPSGERYANIRGRVVSVNLRNREMTIFHEAIPGFMPAMQMTYSVDPQEVAAIEGGDRIRFTLEVVGPGLYRMADVQKTSAAPVPPPSRIAATQETISSPGTLYSPLPGRPSLRAVAPEIVPDVSKPATPSLKQYSGVRGTVVSVDSEGSLTVNHEEIPGFMPAMRMTYSTGADAQTAVQTGDTIRFTLEVVNPGEYRISEFRVESSRDISPVPVPSPVPSARLPAAPLTPTVPAPSLAPLESRPTVPLESVVPGRQFVNVKGKLLVFGPGRRSVVIDHEAIPGFMPAMKMTYAVDPELVSGLSPNQSVRFTLLSLVSGQYQITRLEEDATPLPVGTAEENVTTDRTMLDSIRLGLTWSRAAGRQQDLSARYKEEANAVSRLRDARLGGRVQVGLGIQAGSGGFLRAGPRVSATVPQPMSRLLQNNAQRSSAFDQAKARMLGIQSAFQEAQSTLHRALNLERGLLDPKRSPDWMAWVETVPLQDPRPAESAVEVLEAVLHARGAIEASHRNRFSKLLPARWHADVLAWPVFWSVLPEWVRAGRYAPELEAEAIEAASARWREAVYLASSDARAALNVLRQPSDSIQIHEEDSPEVREAKYALLRMRLEAAFTLRGWNIPVTASSNEAGQKVEQTFQRELELAQAASAETASYLRAQKPRANERRLMNAVDQVAMLSTSAPEYQDIALAQDSLRAAARRDAARSRPVQVDIMASVAGQRGMGVFEDPQTLVKASPSSTVSLSPTVRLPQNPVSTREAILERNRALEAAAQARSDKLWDERWMEASTARLDQILIPATLEVLRAEVAALEQGVDSEKRLNVLREKIRGLESRLARAASRVQSFSQTFDTRPWVADASWRGALASYRAARAEQTLVKNNSRSWTGQGMAQRASGASTVMGMVGLDNFVRRPVWMGLKRIFGKSLVAAQDHEAEQNVRAQIWDAFSEFYQVKLRRDWSRRDLSGYESTAEAIQSTLRETDSVGHSPALIARLRSDLAETQVEISLARFRSDVAQEEYRAWEVVIQTNMSPELEPLREKLQPIYAGWPVSELPPPALALQQKEFELQDVQKRVPLGSSAVQGFVGRMADTEGVQKNAGVSVSALWDPATKKNETMALQREVAVLDQEAFETRQTLLREREMATARAQVWLALANSLQDLSQDEKLSAVERGRTQSLARAYERLAVTTSLRSGGPERVEALDLTAPIRWLTVKAEDRAQFVQYVAYHCPCTDCQTPQAGANGDTREVRVTGFAGGASYGAELSAGAWTLKDAGQRQRLKEEWTVARSLRTWKAEDNAQKMQERVNGFFAVQDAALRRIEKTQERLLSGVFQNPELLRQALVDYFVARADLAETNAALNRDVVEIIKALVPDSVNEVAWESRAGPRLDLHAALPSQTSDREPAGPDVLPSIPWTPQAVALNIVRSSLSQTGAANPGGGNRIMGDWSLKTLEGKSVKWADFSGKVVFVNFWATWCAPCVAEMGSIDRLWDTFKDRTDVAFLLVTEESADVVRTFLKQHPTRAPIYITNGKRPKGLESLGIPTTFILSKTGEILIKVQGADRWDSKANVDRMKEWLGERPARAASNENQPSGRRLKRSA